MKSETIGVQQLFQDRRQYCVPFYQRRYVWTLEDQWEQLWEDIRAKAEARIEKEKPTPHFLGAVVLDPQAKEGLIGVDVLHIIDGQQRLTTLQYVLRSLIFALAKTGAAAFVSTVSGCLENGNADTMRDQRVEKYKLWPTFQDRASYQGAMDASDLDSLKVRFAANFTAAGELRKIGADHPAPLAALWHFTRWFSEWIGNDSATRASRAEALVLAVLKDLKLVTIVLDQDDDAQVIFETLNGRGATLNATDLIRNHVFMRADREGGDSEELYDTLWSPFETPYWNAAQRRGRILKPRLEWFIHAVLQAELGDEVDLGRLYHEYRRYAASIPANDQLEVLAAYATHYQHLVSANTASPIGRFGARIAGYDITTLHPLALLISRSDVSDSEKSEMFGDLVSYVVRRSVCNLGNKNYNAVFVSALRHLKKSGVSPTALRAFLASHKGNASRWPTDAEFRSACTTVSLYDDLLDASVMRAILTALEAHLRTTAKTEEPLLPNLEGLDIDHILPKAWTTHWPLPDGTHARAEELSETRLKQITGDPLTSRQELIAKRQSLVQTLGNLTLLNYGVNRAAKNEAFVPKRDRLIANTALRLNVPLVACTKWSEDDISTRSDLMASAALEIWPGPR